MSSTIRAQAARSIEYLCPRHAGLDLLLVRVGEGDRDAFAAFYDAVSQTVYSMSLRSGHEPRLSAQVTYDVILRAWQQARTFDPELGSAWSWLHDIALQATDGRTGTHESPAGAHEPPPPA